MYTKRHFFFLNPLNYTYNVDDYDDMMLIIKTLHSL